MAKRPGRLLAALRGLARRRRTPIFLVGGAVRDSLLGRVVRDYDLAVPSPPKVLALALGAASWGKAFALSPGRVGLEVWRVAGKGLTIDIAGFEAPLSLEKDLRRRDFTVNALALDVASGAVMDPTGGLGDLSRGILRAVSKKNLLDDPLRILRAYRLAATHGFRLEPGTRALLRRLRRRLSRAAPERIHQELVHLWTSAEPLPALRAAAADGVLATAFLLPSSRNFASALRAVSRLGLPSQAGPAELLADRLALFFHRLGVSPPATATALQRRKFSNQEVRAVCRRLRFLTLAFSERDPRLVLFEFREDADSLLKLLPVAWRGRSERRRSTRLSRQYRRCRAGEPPVNGHDLQRWLGLSASPLVGELLNLARLRFFTGEWKNRQEIRRGVEAIRSIRARTVDLSGEAALG
jgi:tRNA nucleotidyltransferase (CCA-adding enzyme)